MKGLPEYTYVKQNRATSTADKYKMDFLVYGMKISLIKLTFSSREIVLVSRHISKH